MGHMWPPSACPQVKNPAARLRCATGLCEVHGSAVSRVELDLVDPVAEAVVGFQLRRIVIGFDAPSEDIGRAADRPERADPVGRPVTTFAFQRLLKGLVDAKEVDVFESRGLIEHLVSG